MQEVLCDDIDVRPDWPIDHLLLHPVLVVRVDPERQTKVESVINMHRHIVLELKLDDEPFEAENAFHVLVVANHVRKGRVAEVESFLEVKDWVAFLVDF